MSCNRATIRTAGRSVALMSPEGSPLPGLPSPPLLRSTERPTVLILRPRNLRVTRSAKVIGWPMERSQGGEPVRSSGSGDMRAMGLPMALAREALPGIAVP